jgi:hypothetical protein
MAYFLTYGEIPKGKMVLHKCDNHPCVRPDHLFAGTQSDNMQDMLRKKRHNHPLIKITPGMLDEIRMLYDRHQELRKEAAKTSARALAKRFGITESHVLKIVHHRAWQPKIISTDL